MKIRQRLFVLSSLLLTLPARAEEWTGTAIGTSGSAQQLELNLDSSGAGTLSIGNDHYVLKLNQRSTSGLSKATGSPASATPEAAEYMARVGTLIKKHWRKTLSMQEKHLIVRFYINIDGSIDGLKLDPTSDQKLDEYTVRAFDAVKQAVPFPPPPTSVLENNKVEIKFAFEVNRRSPTSGFGRSLLNSP